MNPDLLSQEILYKIFETINIAVFTFDKDKKVTYSNAADKNLLLVSTEEKLLRSAESGHFNENECYDVDGNLLDYPKGSPVERALNGEETKNLLLEHRNKKDHAPRWLCISCVPIFNDEGEFQYGILWYTDASKAKSREDKLKFLIASTRILSIALEFENRLIEKAKLTVPSLADWCSVHIVNPDGSLKRLTVVHRDPEKMDFIKEYDKKYPSIDKTETDITRVVRTNKAEFMPLITETMIDNMPGLSSEQKNDIKYLQLSSMITVPISTGGKVLGVLTFAYAESGRVYSEEDFEFVKEFANHLAVLLENARLYNEISKRDISKDAFLASLSHELRNPLAPIRTSLEVIRLKNPNSIFRDEINIISHEFAHLTRLLNDLLDSTRFTQGKINISPEATDITYIIEQVVRSVKTLLHDANINLKVCYPSQRLHLYGDRTRLEQAFTNILNNAVKFTPTGGSICIDITEQNKNVVIKITDSGVGITSDEVTHIFDPYYQSLRVKNGNNGLGIGLFLVHQIITLHKGTITVASKGQNHGSEFTITLPLIKTNEKPRLNASMPTVGESKIKKILVVDDNKVAADSLVRLLDALGWQAVAVYSGVETIEFLEKRVVDLVFLDIGMPEMSGYELIRILRQNDKFKDLPIIAVTGYGLEDDKIKAIQSGFNAHITKPIGARDLREILTGDIVA